MAAHKGIVKAVTENYTVGVRLQKMGFVEQAIVLARLAQARTTNNHFTPKQLEEMFEGCVLPKPTTERSCGILRP